MSFQENKAERIIFRVSAYEKKLTLSKAKKAKINVSDFCRKAGLDKEIKYIDGLSEISYDLNKIGNNINQIAVAANQGRDVAPTMEAIKNKMFQTLDTIEKVLGGDGDSNC